jgi:hypothetical protein
VCQTADRAVDDLARIAFPVEAMLCIGDPGANDIATRLGHRLPPNMLPQLWSGSIARGTNPARGSTSQSPTGPSMPLQAGTTIAFGLRATSGTGAALAASGAGCELC